MTEMLRAALAELREDEMRSLMALCARLADERATQGRKAEAGFWHAVAVLVAESEHERSVLLTAAVAAMEDDSGEVGEIVPGV